MVWGEGRAAASQAATQGTLNLTIETAGASRTGGCQLLPAGHAAHVGQLVGDALVAVDAGLLAREQEARPLMQCGFTPVIEELLARVDGAENLAPDLLRGLHLAGDLVGPVVRDV